MLTCTVFAAWPSTISTTSFGPAPRRDGGSCTFTWSSPANEGCGPAYSTGTLSPPIVHVTPASDDRLRIPVPYSERYRDTPFTRIGIAAAVPLPEASAVNNAGATAATVPVVVTSGAPACDTVTAATPVATPS